MYAVILAGGSRTRHRPLAGGRLPIALVEDSDGRTLLQRIVARLAPLIDPADIVVVTDRRLGQTVRSIVPAARILPEPVHRDTAASIALATVAVERPADEPMLVIAADHEIEDAERFRSAVGALGEALMVAGTPAGAPLCAVTVPPADAEPGFSFIQPRFDAAMRLGDLRLYPTQTFEAHPDGRRAQELYATGTTSWTAGIFLWRRDAIHAALERYTPLLTLIEPAHRSELALKAAYDRLQPLSIDEAVLVGAARDGLLVSVPLDVGWREVAPSEEPAGTMLSRRLL